jgi:hypothetical protein
VTRVDVVAEDLAELGVVEPVALDADDERLLGQRNAGRAVLGEARCHGGMDRDRPLASREVDIVPLEPEQLAATKPGGGHQREQEPVALPLAAEVALPAGASLRTVRLTACYGKALVTGSFYLK